jgi:hypothetical protein
MLQGLHALATMLQRPCSRDSILQRPGSTPLYPLRLVVLLDGPQNTEPVVGMMKFIAARSVSLNVRDPFGYKRRVPLYTPKLAAARVDYLASIPESISGPEIEKEMSM